jgi:predicted heme/steroid binding protein
MIYFKRNRLVSMVLLLVLAVVVTRLVVMSREPEGLFGMSVTLPVEERASLSDQGTTTAVKLRESESASKPVVSAKKQGSVAPTVATSTTALPATPASLPSAFTAATLAHYDGTDASLPILIAFASNVYDVSDGKSYYGPGGVYHFLAGTDGTTLLEKIGGDIIKRKYKVIGTFTP